MPVPAAQIVVLLANIGGPMMGLLDPGHQPANSSMEILIADESNRVAGGSEIRYQVTVTNGTNSSTPVTIRLHLSPSAISDVRAADAAVVANAVAWKKELAPGETQTYTAAGIVAATAESVAATACVHIAPHAPAVACASDLTAFAPQTGNERKIAWILSIALGFLAVIGAVWLQKKITPELLTPANAAAAFGDEPPGQPGGAPSV